MPRSLPHVTHPHKHLYSLSRSQDMNQSVAMHVNILTLKLEIMCLNRYTYTTIVCIYTGPNTYIEGVPNFDKDS